MRIVLADDHDLVRDSLVALISHYSVGSEVVGVNCVEAALAALRSGLRYDLVILDLHMPGMNGLVGLKKVIAEWPGLPVVLMSGAAHGHDIEAALEMGARGYLPKTMAGRGLVQALELIVAGEIFLPSTALRSTVHRSGGDEADRSLNLTEREHQVLHHLKEGLANKEIGLRLGIQETTVKLHLRTLSKKFEAKNRTDLVLKAMQLGMAD